VVQRIFSVFVICWLRQLKRYHVLRYTANAGGRPTSGSQLASTPLRELPAHTKRPPVDRGPCFALALLRYSFQVGFEPSLLQRQFIARGLAAVAWSPPLRRHRTKNLKQSDAFQPFRELKG
jgi:hypothetical protein